MCAGTGESDDRGVNSDEEFGGVSPLSALFSNYDKIDGASKARGRAVGAEHEEILAKTDGYMTAWMLFYLKGDGDAGSVFFGEEPEIMYNSNWQDVEISR